MRELFFKLRDKLLNTTPKICIERAKIVTEAYKKYDAYPNIEKRAMALADVLRNMTIYIEEEQLLAGNQASSNRAAPLFPEYAFAYILDELDDLEKRSSDKFTITEENKKVLREILPWWEGKTLKDRAIAMQPQEVLDDRVTGVLGWQGNVSTGEGHIVPDYDMVVRLGFAGLRDKIQKHIDELDLSKPQDLEKLTFYRACKAIIDGCLDYIKRYCILAEEQAEQCKDAARKEELLGISERCQALLERAPETFFEALQCVWFVQVILHIETNGHSLSFGRFDQYMNTFLQKDLKEGRITMEEAEEMLGCFYLKIYSNNKLRSWSNTLTQMGSPTYQNICLGGQKADKTDAVNEMSWLCLEMLDEIRLPEPTMYIRVHENISEAFLKRAVKIVKQGVGMPAFVNDQTIIPALERRGVTKEDSWNYSTMGCTEVQVPGKWGYRANGKSKINLLKILEIVLNGGKDPRSGKQVFTDMKPLEEYTSIEELKQAYKRAIEYYMRLHVIADNVNELAMTQMTPDAFCSLLMQDCLGRGKAIKEGGTIYDMVSGTLVGIPNVGNAVYAIKKNVFDEKRMTAAELKEALDTDFAGEKGKVIRKYLLERTEKYGNDEKEVDKLTNELANYYVNQIYHYKTLREGKGPIGCCYTSSTVTITANIPSGAIVGASADGRKKGMPTADGISPSTGTMKKGLTAMFQSVGTLNTELFTGGQLLNVRINPSTLKTEEDEDKFIQILKAAGNLHCWHSQYNVVSNETLRDAQKHPENYQDLMVRVAGYNALFTSLNQELQEDIIARTQMDL